MVWKNGYAFCPIYRKIPKIKPRGSYFSKALFEGLIFGGAYIRRRLFIEGYLRFKIDWASLVVGRNWPYLLYFGLYSRAISKYKPPGDLYSEGRLNGGFFTLRVWGLIFGGSYTWKGLFSEFYGSFFSLSVKAVIRFTLGTLKSPPATRIAYELWCGRKYEMFLLTEGAFHLSELTGQTIPVVMRISLLIKISSRWVKSLIECTKEIVFSAKTLWKKHISFASVEGRR